MRTKILIFVLLLILMSVGFVYADPIKDAEFNDLVYSLREEGSIPRVRGRVTSFGNYEDSYANMGMAQWFTMTESENFVLSAKLKWISASETPAFNNSGCGVIFGADVESGNHLLAFTALRAIVFLVYN